MPYRRLLFGVLVAIIASISTVFAMSYWQSRGTITIQNRSHHTVNDVYVVYVQYGTEQKSWIGALPAHQEYQYRINYANIHEGNMYISYQDEQKKLISLM